MTKVGVTERQSAILEIVEDEVTTDNAAPSTVELSKRTGYSTGEIARILDALEYMDYITRITGRRRNIRLCSPAVKMAPDDYLVAELTKRGYLGRELINRIPKAMRV